MVLWGQSAGSGSVNAYAYSYPHHPIVTGFIADSGVPNMIGAPDPSGQNFTNLAALVGCGGLGQEAEFECMQRAYSNNTFVSFVPRGDDLTAPINATERISKGLISDKVGWGAIFFRLRADFERHVSGKKSCAEVN